ncbi:MAG TPA: hypothetical protein VIP11_20920 [Gemmatimonadaceae bacterium]
MSEIHTLTPGLPASPRRVGTWRAYFGLAAITVILVLQNTKQAMLPRTQTPVLWVAVAAVLVSVLVLRSGWGRDNQWAHAQGELGTLANNFYEPRRDALINGFGIGGGVLGALWWGTATWGVILGGMRREVMTRGLVDFEVAALVGAITGGVLGAVAGLAIGHWWETRHRRRRVRRMSNV